MGCSVEGSIAFIVFFNLFVASSDDVGISYEQVDVGGNKEAVQSCYFPGIVFAFPSPTALFASFNGVRVSVPEDVSEVELSYSSNDLASGLSSVIVYIAVVVVVKLGEDAHIPVSDSDCVLLGVEDSVLKDLLKERGIVSMVLGTI